MASVDDSYMFPYCNTFEAAIQACNTAAVYDAISEEVSDIYTNESEEDRARQEVLERRLNEYWDELLGTSPDVEIGEADESDEELDEHGDPLPYWATRSGRAEYFNENGDPVFAEDIEAGRAPPNPNCYTVEESSDESDDM
jgi:hypothetical protein